MKFLATLPSENIFLCTRCFKIFQYNFFELYYGTFIFCSQILNVLNLGVSSMKSNQDKNPWVYTVKGNIKGQREWLSFDFNVEHKRGKRDHGQSGFTIFVVLVSLETSHIINIHQTYSYENYMIKTFFF